MEFSSDLDSFDTRLDSTLKKRARELTQLTDLLRCELPPECDGHYHVANIHGSTLVIMTDSPVWTTRIRQLGPRILNALQNHGRKKLVHNLVFSRPGHSPVAKPPTPSKKKHEPISDRSSRLISQTASFIDNDDLRDALLKLPRHPADKQGS